MKSSNEKRNAIFIIILSFVLGSISTYLVKETDAYKTYGTYEGNGLIVGPLSLILNIYGFLKLARAKGRSELLALILSFFTFAGLVVLLLLKDLRSSDNN